MSRTRTSSENELRDQIERMAHRTAAITALVDDYLGPLDTAGWQLLRLVERDGPVRASELAVASRLSRPSVSRCITALEQAGLVRATPDPQDGRASLVSTTPEGSAHVERLADVGRQRIRELTDDFSVDEVDQLSRLLHRLNDNADRHAVSPARYRFERASS